MRIHRVQQNPPGVVWGLGVLGQVLLTWKYDGKVLVLKKIKNKKWGICISGSRFIYIGIMRGKDLEKNDLKVWVGGWGLGGGESLVKVQLHRNMTGKVLDKTDLKRKGGGGKRVLGQGSFTWNCDRERFW